MRFSILTAVALLVCVPACGDKGPCDGGGMGPDERALPDDWAKVAPPPSSAVMCHAADGSTDQKYARNWDTGKNPEEGWTTWHAHLTGKGWQQTDETNDGEGRTTKYALDGATLELYVSKSVTHKGWVTTTFTPKAP